MAQHTTCRICEDVLPEPFLDLGTMPLANAFLSSPAEFSNEKSYPLAVTNCLRCGLVQLTHVVSAEELYRDYIYVSSTSEAVRTYAKALAERFIRKLKLNKTHLVVEVGSNDGTVLKAFQKQGIRVLGVEPARNIAKIAVEGGIPTVNEFFTADVARSLAKEYGQASVILGRHVFAHIHEVHDFLEGVSRLLDPDGVLLIEVPYLGDLVDKLEFDTIYHEHLSYFALKPVKVLCERHHLSLGDVERVPLHGGSILLIIRKAQGSGKETDPLKQMMDEEERHLCDRKKLEQFGEKVFEWKELFEEFIDRFTAKGNFLMGYGAAAKANTLLNFVPRSATSMKFILDKSPHKQGRYTPGTHIPVVPVEQWQEERATHILILAWNFQEEIRRQLSPFAARGGRFIIPIPKPEVV